MTTWTPEVLQLNLWHKALLLSCRASFSLDLSVPLDFVPPREPPDRVFWAATWTRAADTIIFACAISLENVRPEDDVAVALRGLAGEIGSWKLWEQLGFDAGLEPGSQCEPGNLARSAFRLRLRRSPEASGGQNVALRNDSELTGNYRQLHTSTVLTLNEIKIGLTVQPRETSRKRQKLGPEQHKNEFESLLDIDDEGPETVPSASSNLLWSHTNKSHGFDDLSCASPRCVMMGQSLLFEDRQLSCQEHSITSGASSMRLSHIDPQGHQPSQAASYEAIVSLVDAAFRIAIVAKPHRIARAILHDHEPNSLRLVNMIPSVFCPGFWQACAEREPYISIVAASLTKIQKRLSHEQDDYWRASETQESHNGIAESEIKGKLRAITRKRLLRQGPAQRLTPLHANLVTELAQMGHSIDFFMEEWSESDTEDFPPSHDDDWRDLLTECQSDSDICVGEPPSSLDSGIGIAPQANSEIELNITMDDDASLFYDGPDELLET